MKETASSAWARYFEHYLINLKDIVDVAIALDEIDLYGEQFQELIDIMQEEDQVKSKIKIERKLPFRWRRIERNNTNGFEKQVKMAARYQYHNEYGRWKTR